MVPQVKSTVEGRPGGNSGKEWLTAWLSTELEREVWDSLSLDQHCKS